MLNTFEIIHIFICMKALNICYSNQQDVLLTIYCTSKYKHWSKFYCLFAHIEKIYKIHLPVPVPMLHLCVSQQVLIIILRGYKCVKPTPQSSHMYNYPENQETDVNSPLLLPQRHHASGTVPQAICKITYKLWPQQSVRKLTKTLLMTIRIKSVDEQKEVFRLHWPYWQLNMS